MDRTFQKFLRSGLDLAPLGVERREENLPYFCTPKGAAIFGWAGVDGIHYCFIRGFGGMVFAVSPMNAAPDCVHPLARDFADFLRLLLACGDAAALEQAWMWNESQFETFMSENPITEKQVQTLSEISEKMKLTPIEYNILLLLIKNQGRVFSINQIYENIWNEEAIAADNTIAVHIRHIREKIEINPKDPRYLKVVWGLGYKVEKI